MPGTEERNWAVACHLSALAGLMFPLGSVLGPLVVWLLGRDRSAFVDAQGKEALNFQLTMLVAYLISLALVWVFIGIPLLIILGIVDIVLVIVAAVRAGAGEAWHYPLSYPLLR